MRTKQIKKGSTVSFLYNGERLEGTVVELDVTGYYEVECFYNGEACIFSESEIEDVKVLD